MKIWLDDRRPAPEGWSWVKTYDEAVHVLRTTSVFAMSLDHDLSACDTCLKVTGVDEYQWLCDGSTRCKCHCHKTGYDLVKWMAENDVWPEKKPLVHSDNGPGIVSMTSTIDRYFRWAK